MDRLFAVEVSGVPDSISDFDIREVIATALGRYFRDKQVLGGYSVGTSGGTVKETVEEEFKHNLVPDEMKTNIVKGRWPGYFRES